MEPIPTSSQLRVLAAIHRVHEDLVENPRLRRFALPKRIFWQLADDFTIKQMIEAAERLLQLADNKSRSTMMIPIPEKELKVFIKMVIELSNSFHDPAAYPPMQEGCCDDRDDLQKLIDNVTDPDTVLVRDPSRTPVLQEIGILEALQRFPCRDKAARWTSEQFIAFLETKSQWLDQALEDCSTLDSADENGMVEAKAVLLVVPEQPSAALETEIVEVLIPLED